MPVLVPVLVRMHPDDNVAIVGNPGGLPAGTVLPGGLVLQEKLPQAHKVALRDLRVGEPVQRYGIPIGYANRDIAAGHWVHERLLTMPEARALGGLPMATAPVPDAAPLDGYTFQGYRNADGSVGTRNLLAVSTTVQCVAGVLDAAVERIRRELLPRYPNVDGVVALTHAYGCGVAIDAPGAEIPIRTLRHLAKNPNFGGEVMLVSLGCEKLQPERLFPPGSIAIADGLAAHHVRLQDEDGFAAMTARILQQADSHLQRLNARRRETVPASALVVGMQCGG
ncbi:MAG: UxaA family hydrolase, partial [Rhodoferax sp.]|nr:UxaA family hydrolase [Rhodoferax sp.]